MAFPTSESACLGAQVFSLLRSTHASSAKLASASSQKIKTIIVATVDTTYLVAHLHILDIGITLSAPAF